MLFYSYPCFLKTCAFSFSWENFTSLHFPFRLYSSGQRKECCIPTYVLCIPADLWNLVTLIRQHIFFWNKSTAFFSYFLLHDVKGAHWGRNTTDLNFCLWFSLKKTFGSPREWTQLPALYVSIISKINKSPSQRSVENPERPLNTVTWRNVWEEEASWMSELHMPFLVLQQLYDSWQGELDCKEIQTSQS